MDRSCSRKGRAVVVLIDGTTVPSMSGAEPTLCRVDFMRPVQVVVPGAQGRILAVG